MSHDLEEGLQREVERIFHDLVYNRHPAAHFSDPTWSPPADLIVSGQQSRVLIELAGVPRESVRVVLNGRVLEISGRRTPPAETRDALYHRAEIFFGEFRRAVELPWEADQRSLDARYRDGLLEIRLTRVAALQDDDLTVERQTS